MRACTHTHTHTHTHTMPLSTYHCQIVYNIYIKEKEVGGREERGKEKLHTCTCVTYSKGQKLYTHK